MTLRASNMEAGSFLTEAGTGEEPWTEVLLSLAEGERGAMRVRLMACRS